jgi:hypothetical protein
MGKSQKQKHLQFRPCGAVHKGPWRGITLYFALKAIRAVSQLWAISATIVFIHRADLSPRHQNQYDAALMLGSVFCYAGIVMNIIKQLQRKQTGYILIVMVADFAFFCFTNPASVPSFVLIIGFLLFIVTLYILIRFLLRGVCTYLPSLRRTRARLAVFVTGIIGVLLALQSIGQLSTRDAIVIVPIAIVLYVYFTYARSKMRPQS